MIGTWSLVAKSGAQIGKRGSCSCVEVTGVEPVLVIGGTGFSARLRRGASVASNGWPPRLVHSSRAADALLATFDSPYK